MLIFKTKGSIGSERFSSTNSLCGMLGSWWDRRDHAYASQSLSAALRGSSPLCAVRDKPSSPCFERSLYWNVFLGYSPVYSYLSCKWVCVDCGHASQADMLCLTELIFLQPLSFTPKSFLCSRTALPLLFVLSSIFFSLSLGLPQLVMFQIWPSCSNDTLPTTCVCTASAVKNVCFQEIHYLREL